MALTNEQTILDLKAELDQIAGEIQTQVNLTATKHTTIQQQMESVENLKGGLLNTVLNERFQINNKLMWTNDTARRIRFNEMAADDVDYKNAQAELYALEEEKAQAQGEAEFQRKKFRAVELTMLFYATNQ